MDVLLLMSIFRLYPRSKVSILHNTARKFLFLSACFCWHSRLTLREMDQKIKFGEISDNGASYLEFLFHLFKVFRLHVTLHDAAGAVREPNGKGPGYCYLIGQRTNSCLLGHVSGLLFGLYVKLSLPSLFNTVDFWSSISCIVLDFELAKNPYLRVGSFFWYECSGILISFSKKIQTHNASSLVYKKLARDCVKQRKFGLQRASRNSS